MIAFTTMKIANATIVNWMIVLMNVPMPIATSGTSPTAGFSTHFHFEKSMPPIARPMGGMITLSTSAVTILPNDAPITTPTARSMTFPRIAKVLNSLNMPMRLLLVDSDGRT